MDSVLVMDGNEHVREPEVRVRAAAPRGSPASPLVSPMQRDVVFGLAVVLLVAVAIFAAYAYAQESSFYDAILKEARDKATCQENAMLFEVALAPFRSLSMVRTAALFLSFVL